MHQCSDKVRGPPCRRRGSKDVPVQITIEPERSPEHWQLSEKLQSLVGRELATKSQVFRSLWAHISAHNLQHTSDPSLITCDPLLKVQPRPWKSFCKPCWGRSSLDVGHLSDPTHPPPAGIDLSHRHSVGNALTPSALFLIMCSLLPEVQSQMSKELPCPPPPPPPQVCTWAGQALQPAHLYVSCLRSDISHVRNSIMLWLLLLS